MEGMKKKSIAIFTFLLLLCTVMTSGWGTLTPTISASAITVTENEFDNTKVEEDLSDLDLSAYPKDKNKAPALIEGGFVEYCYTDNVFKKSNYGLYLYVYNPDQTEYSVRGGANVVNMAISYDENGNPNEYSNKALKYLGKSTGEYENLFYKFKLEDVSDIFPIVTDYNKQFNERRYDISGIQLYEKGSSNAKEYGVSYTYRYSGYSKGYDEESEEISTLKCNGEKLETVQLKVKHTFYRSQTSALGAGHQNQLDTVYFAVPNRLLAEYGKLQRIKAEWYEYKTKEIVVTSNTDFYNAANPYIGVKIGGEANSTGQYEYDEDIPYSLGINAGDAGGGAYMAKWGWNLGTGYFHPACNVLYYLFHVNDISNYDPYADITEIGGVTSNALYDWIKNYDKSYENGKLPIKDGSISADLFEDDIDESRKIDNKHGKIQKGYSYYDFDADVDLQTLTSWSDTKPSFWDNWLNFGLGAAFTGGPEEESKTVAPIQILKNEDISGTDSEISERLLVNYSDVARLKTFYNKAEAEGNAVVLFRFATSDYYAEAADIIELNKGLLWSDKHTEGQVYIARESVFFDFDIIQLTFNKNGEQTIIAAVSDPIDIVNAITPPVQTSEDNNWWKTLFGVVMIVLLIVWIAWFLKCIIKKETESKSN